MARVARSRAMSEQRVRDLVRQHNKNVEVIVYPGCGHAFFADYRTSYDAGASAVAWAQCTVWFGKYLKA